MKFLILSIALMGSFFFSFLQGGEKPGSLPPLIPRKLLFDNPEKAGAKLSPDGTKLAYLAPDENNILNVWVRDLKNGGVDKRITNDRKRGIYQYLWQFNNEAILYLQDKDGDENSHLYQTQLATLETKDLTPFEGVKAGLVDNDFRFPNEVLIQLNRRDPSLYDVYRLNLETGKLDLDTENPGDVIGWVADHHLVVRVSQSVTEDGSTLIRVRNGATSPWRDWMTISPLETGAILGFSADNHSLYALTSIDSNTARLLKVNLETGEKSVMTEDSEYDLGGIVLHPTTYALQAAEVEREKNEWIPFDPQIKEDFSYLSDRFKGPFMLASRDLADQNWIVVSQSDQRPSHYYLYRRPGKKLEFLFSTKPSLERYQLSPMKPIKFQARDGMMLHGYLTLPSGVEPRNLPTVLLVHGGPWARDSWGLSPTVQWLANRGYAVLQINFRGSTGFGKAYLNAGNKEWAGTMHNDLIDGKGWMVKNGYANPDKVAIMGGSYGGYATLVGLTFTPEAFCCGIDIVGPSNLVTLLQTFPPYWKPMKAKMDIRVGSLEKDKEDLIARSPLFKVDQITKPLLIGQGANDPRVKQAESDQIVEAMRKKNIPVEYLLFTDEGHGFVRPENRMKFNAAAEAFLAKHLGGRLEPASAEENWEEVKK